jgi:hypothetical protein
MISIYYVMDFSGSQKLQLIFKVLLSIKIDYFLELSSLNEIGIGKRC